MQLLVNIMRKPNTVMVQDGTSPYFGAVVGRVANRIANATFWLDDEFYQLSANENETSLHGGKVGFSRRVWKGHAFSEGKDSGVMLQYESPDGEEVKSQLYVFLCCLYNTYSLRH